MLQAYETHSISLVSDVPLTDFEINLAAIPGVVERGKLQGVLNVNLGVAVSNIILEGYKLTFTSTQQFPAGTGFPLSITLLYAV